MRLCVKNLGPVHEAEIDLSKPLIILTGPNNSGKTYVSWVVYSLARVEVALGSVPAGVQRVADALCEANDQEIGWDAISPVLDEVLDDVAGRVTKQLAGDFGAPKNRFAKSQISLADGQLRLEQLRFGGRYGSFLLNSDTPHVSVLLVSDTTIALTTTEETRSRNAMAHGNGVSTDNDLESPRAFFRGLDDATKLAIKFEVAKAIYYIVINALLERNTIAFPVERLAINLFARELAATRTGLIDDLLNESDPASLRDELRRRAGHYPRVITDALQRAIRNPRTSELGEFADLAEELETSVLGGQIKTNAVDELEFVPGQDTDKAPLGLHETASVVKSLASLVLFLRYQARPGQRLLIDEPELNLHPDNQRQIARVLAKAVNRGLKILMSTHSDYVIRELNNLIMLGQDSDEARELARELNYDPTATLDGSKLGVYLIANGTCRALPVSETGFEVDTIDQAIQSLNNDAQAIYLRLFSE